MKIFKLSIMEHFVPPVSMAINLVREFVFDWLQK